MSTVAAMPIWANKPKAAPLDKHHGAATHTKPKAHPIETLDMTGSHQTLRTPDQDQNHQQERQDGR
jgi:hypothetical protein